MPLCSYILQHFLKARTLHNYVRSSQNQEINIGIMLFFKLRPYLIIYSSNVLHTQKKKILGSFAFSCHGTSFWFPLIYNSSQAFVCIGDITIFWRAQTTYFEACFSIWVYWGYFWWCFFFPPSCLGSNHALLSEIPLEVLFFSVVTCLP